MLDYAEAWMTILRLMSSPGTTDDTLSGYPAHVLEHTMKVANISDNNRGTDWIQDF